jgi:hypothetical protein
MSDDNNDIPHWFRPELRRVSRLYHKGILDSTSYMTTKQGLMTECHEAILTPHLKTRSRTVSPKKLKRYVHRLHSSRKKLNYDEDLEQAKNKLPDKSYSLKNKKVWKPTGALVIREHPESKTSDRLTTIDGTSTNNFQTPLPRQHKRITVASALRINELSQPRKSHSFFSAHAKMTTDYTSIEPQKYYSKPFRIVTASPWPFFRAQQENDGLSVTSTNASTHKITHPILLYNAQKKYCGRIEHHLTSQKKHKFFKTNRKLPSLDNSSNIPTYIRY